MAKRHRGHEPDVVRITTAPVSRSDELRHREKRYVVSMGIRTLCFVAAVIAGPGFGIFWLMWVLLAASLFLPYIAVVMANAASPVVEGTDLEQPTHEFPELESGDQRPTDRPDEEHE
jgi:hypothetical protein